MATHNWCHNPDCHTIRTTSRVRGSGNNKVLRTVKINTDNRYIQESIFQYFCNNNCLFAFLNKFRNEVANIRPVREPSETPIKVVKEKYESSKYVWNDNDSYERKPYTATRTTIQEGDND
jgi:hypothetical protein